MYVRKIVDERENLKGESQLCVRWLDFDYTNLMTDRVTDYGGASSITWLEADWTSILGNAGAQFLFLS